MGDGVLVSRFAFAPENTQITSSRSRRSLCKDVGVSAFKAWNRFNLAILCTQPPLGFRNLIRGNGANDCWKKNEHEGFISMRARTSLPRARRRRAAPLQSNTHKTWPFKTSSVEEYLYKHIRHTSPRRLDVILKQTFHNNALLPRYGCLWLEASGH